MQKKTEVLTQVLKYGTSLERKAGLMEVEKLPPEHQKSFHEIILVSVAKEKEPTMKMGFLRAIGSLKIMDAREFVYESLDSTNEDLSRAAIGAIRKLDLEDSPDRLTDRLKKEDLTKNSNLSVSLIEALGEIPGGERAAEFLEARLKEKFNSPEIRAQIALYLGKKKITGSEVTLQQIAFENTEPLTIRTYCINSLGKIGSQSSAPKLKELLEEIIQSPSGDSKKNQQLKIYSLGALVELGEESVFDQLVDFTKDDDSMVRLRAIQFLLETGRPEVKEILEYKSKRDPSPRVQKAALDGLKKLEGGGDPKDTSEEDDSINSSSSSSDSPSSASSESEFNRESNSQKEVQLEKEAKSPPKSKSEKGRESSGK